MVTQSTPLLRLVLLLVQEPQYSIAARCHMSASRLSRVANGIMSPTISEKRRLANYFQMPADELFRSVTPEEMKNALETAAEAAL